VCFRAAIFLLYSCFFFFFAILEQKEEVLKKQRAEKEKLKAFREKVSIILYNLNVVIKPLREKYHVSVRISLYNLIFQIEENINKFLQDESLQKQKFEPMEQVYRSIVYVLWFHFNSVRVVTRFCESVFSNCHSYNKKHKIGI